MSPGRPRKAIFVLQQLLTVKPQVNPDEKTSEIFVDFVGENEKGKQT